ncbi:hypothetical protein ACFE04_019187 [Oxalis oulophora]
MKVSVEILTGGFFYIELANGTGSTVGDLKKAIAAQENLPEDRMIFVLKDTEQQFSDDETLLLDYGVQDESHMYLLFTMPDPIDTNHVLPSSVLDFVLDSNDNPPSPKKGDKDAPIVIDDSPENKKN